MGSESDESDDLEPNHQDVGSDREKAGAKKGKVRKLVVIYIHSNPCSTTQVSCTCDVSLPATWPYADLGSESDQSDDLGHSHQYLESEREVPGTKMGKVRKLVVIYIRSNPCSTTQVHRAHHVAPLTTWSQPDLGSESDESDDLEQNDKPLDSNREELGTKMGT